jgi:hypothetical protein
VKNVDLSPLPKGRVKVQFGHEDGSIENIFDDHNLVVNGYRDVTNNLLAGDFINPVKRIAVGVGGHVLGDLSTPIPPQPTDTALETELLVKDIDSYGRPSTDEVEYTITFAGFEGNGELTEAGLFAEDGSMIARVTFPNVTKTVAVNMLITWNLSF